MVLKIYWHMLQSFIMAAIWYLTSPWSNYESFIFLENVIFCKAQKVNVIEYFSKL